jgi:hypothetical protein
MIQIHNFYCDLLLSIPLLIDNNILPSNYIKNYQFNIANRTFNLFNTSNKSNPYQPNYDLPAAIVELQDHNFIFGKRPSNIQFSTLTNTNQIPILYNKEKDITCYLQEDHVQTNINILINTSSQLQAKDIEYAFENILPLNKFIQFHKFCSYLEIPREFLIDIDLNPRYNQIYNLYSRLNKNTGGIEYTYGIEYQPLIQLNSIDSTISQTQQTFTTSISLTYQLQMPLYVVYSKEYNINRINIDFTRFGHEPISPVRPQTISNEEEYNKHNKVFMNLLVHEIDNLIENDNKIYFSITIPIEDLDLSIIDNINILDIYGKPHYNVGNPVFNMVDNKVSIELDSNKFDLYFRPGLTNPIIIQFVQTLN